ncbi:hypothetical protein [Actinophytocola glycyrrhizae]|uniref:Excreted virulence factor EspC (Type VII ESX diderm) n=1 Tax=Actinophytocola glycyrrhizae TaxID=2044873 RepID=A0ABV9S564_9PSEU
MHRQAGIVTAVIPGLIMADKQASDGVSAIARDMRITAAPKHPGQDPVSVHFVNELVSVLRGDGGFVSRLTAVTERLENSAAQLDASRRGLQSTDQDVVGTFGRIQRGGRP